MLHAIVRDNFMDFNCFFLPPFQIRSPNNEAREDFVFQNWFILRKLKEMLHLFQFGCLYVEIALLFFWMNACLFNFCQFNCLQSSPTHLLVANLIQLLRSNPFIIDWRQNFIIYVQNISVQCPSPANQSPDHFRLDKHLIPILRAIKGSL